MERLHVVLAHAGLGSRRECEQLIVAGRVSVNGALVRELGTKVDAARDRVVCDGEPLRRSTRTYCFVVNKPRGYICSNAVAGGRPRAIDLIRHVDERLYTVGRLDMDSEGLLIITNDGELCNLLTHPRYQVPKTYLVKARGALDAGALEQIQKGVWLAEGRTAPARVRILKRSRQSTTAEVTLREGRNREVRRVFARVGHPVSYLSRTHIGHLALGELRPGQYVPIAREALLAAIGAVPEKGFARPERPGKAGKPGGRPHAPGRRSAPAAQGRPAARPSRPPLVSAPRQAPEAEPGHDGGEEE